MLLQRGAPGGGLYRKILSSGVSKCTTAALLFETLTIWIMLTLFFPYNYPTLFSLSI